MTKHCTSRLKNFNDDSVRMLADKYGRKAFTLERRALLTANDDDARKYLRWARRSLIRALRCTYELNRRGIPYNGYMYGTRVDDNGKSI